MSSDGRFSVPLAPTGMVAGAPWPPLFDGASACRSAPAGMS